MKMYEVLERYVNISSSSLQANNRVLSSLRNHGITEPFLFESFSLGYANGSIPEMGKESEELNQKLSACGLLKNGKEIFKNRLIIPIYDENRVLVNIVGYSLHPQAKSKLIWLKPIGIFNSAFLQNSSEIVLTDNPLHTLKLIQQDYPNTTFLFGSDQKYVHFMQEHRIRKIFFAFEGKTRLFYELSRNGVSAKRVKIDFEQLTGKKAKEYLDNLLSGNDMEVQSSDTIKEIENGFLFQFPHLSYRVIGNFSEYTMNMKANIKAFTDQEAFVDSIDLYKNRDRQNYIFNLMDRFNIRDQIQLEKDLNQIIGVIEKHKEKKESEKKKLKPELTDYQRQIGLKLLSNPKLLDEIEEDFSHLGYVRERKNKLLLYLVMTSRLMDTPLHCILISRSGAGKSMLVEITEQLCPPEDLHSVSDLTAQSLYYYGKDDLVHKFIVIGEKEGSEGADYPLRELITKKSITKAIPMKDSVTGQIKTVSITVNGPVSLAETTTSSIINPENLNRCFVIGIDESEEQTQLIHELQRKNHTIEGHLQKQDNSRIIEKHAFTQRLLKKILIINPFAELLCFPSSKLKTRRDHEKFLRLIDAICFLHQYQRKIKKRKIENGEQLEYIECSLQDYRIAYELLSDGVLDNTLDDLPSSTRKLLELIKKYLQGKSKQDNIPIEKIIFERKEIREYTSWSFAQVRNNFRILRDYEYLQLIKAKNGLANKYRLNGNYSDVDFLNKILSPEELEKRIAAVRD